VAPLRERLNHCPIRTKEIEPAPEEAGSLVLVTVDRRRLFDDSDPLIGDHSFKAQP